jgi:hypothetical protein
MRNAAGPSCGGAESKMRLILIVALLRFDGDGSRTRVAPLCDALRPGHEKIAIDNASRAEADLPVVPIGRS